MTAATDFKITKIERSKLSNTSLDDIPFGTHFTDHMFEVNFVNGEWVNPEIKPYQPILLQPSLAALHYGQAIFEGIKAYKTEDGEVKIFRPLDNHKRFNISAERIRMPQIPEYLFMEGLKQVISIDRNWVPSKTDHSLYIRPFMFSSEETIGVKDSGSYKFLIILSPTGPYYSAPMRIYVEEFFVRATPGGVGYAKFAGNYAMSMYATAQAREKGYDQVLWTDAIEHKYVQECGVMNVFFQIGNTVITPSLEQGTILAGITRDSVITVLKELGYNVEERELSIHEVTDAYKAGTLKEIFGTGTAATISMIKELRYKDFEMKFDTDNWQLAPKIKSVLNDIRYGKVADAHGWMEKV